ncbi:uncharacterized protein LOC130975209 [Arachis stenosperma]|uniref:uncharacterized protein LOC130975209 n=1 Tax=Arachis stenosperma TaxID=217475 RepID=UPI0025ABFC84|nr:uncharacterized protein LOC130975209 [Arachis stenosperma]
MGEDIDRIISAEIPNEVNDLLYYEAMEKHMMHCPCGSIRKDSPCMENGQCMRHFPKRFVATTIDEDGYPVYRHRDDGKIITKSGVELNNRYVVPHNRKLLLKYGAHINVEWCNQSRSIKYLFKYVNKGHDRVTALFYRSAISDTNNDQCDEISMYYDCRNPSVVRLGFHLPGEQPVIFKDDENLDDVVRKESVKESMFLGWFEFDANYEWGNNKLISDELRYDKQILTAEHEVCGSSIDGIDNIKIPDDILIHDWDDPISSMCKATYPELFCGSSCVSHVKDKAILVPTLQLVDEINNYMMSLNPSKARTYYSSDTVSESETNNDILASIHTPEFLNTIRCSGVPNHEITVKVGTPLMLLRNIDH